MRGFSNRLHEPTSPSRAQTAGRVAVGLLASARPRMMMFLMEQILTAGPGWLWALGL